VSVAGDYDERNNHIGIIQQYENMQFGIFLREAMHIGNVTQAELAAKASLSQGAISRYLNGKASPKAEELLRIAAALGVSMEWLLTGKGDPPAKVGAGDRAAIGRIKSEAERLARLLGEAESSLGRLRSFLD
jgi:transcriptional regulator with XRE-family HTH domain